MQIELKGKFVRFNHFNAGGLHAISEIKLLGTWVCNKIVPNAFLDAEKTLAVRSDCACFVIIFCFTSILFEKGLNQLLFELRSYLFINLLEENFFWTVRGQTSLVAIPK
jgi:hypothetical protein